MTNDQHSDKKALKQKWIQALLSGEYTQTKGYLHVVESTLPDKPVGHCCLGVLCDIVQEPETVNEQDLALFKHYSIFVLPATFYKSGDDGLPYYGYPPPQVANLLELNRTCDDRETLKLLGHQDHESIPTIGGALTELNDKNFTFTQIAEVIERIV